MVLVTVGNATQGFPRLLSAVDRLAGERVFGDELVIMQAGNTAGISLQHCDHRRFLPMDEFIALVQNAALVIAHAGAGTLFNVFQAGKIPVVMPRRKRYREHVDDHQVELVRALTSAGRVVPAFEPEDLPDAIARVRRCPMRPTDPEGSKMRGLVAQAIEDLLENRR